MDTNNENPPDRFSAKANRIIEDAGRHFARFTRNISGLRRNRRGTSFVASELIASLPPYEPADTFDAMYIVAHPDDSLLFQSPSLLQNIQKGLRVVTVHLTAGDAGMAESYWRGREAGIEAAYARMADSPNSWSAASFVVDGHHLVLNILLTRPNVVLMFLRLPDGGFPNGLGTKTYRYQSLMQLWRGTQRSISAVDGSNSFDRDDLINTLAKLMNSFQPSLIATQDFGTVLTEGDHADHYATANFSQEAHKLYAQPHRLLGHVGYASEHHPANIDGDLLTSKQEIFYTYGSFDELACDSDLTCSGSSYAAWLRREYVLASESVGAETDHGIVQAPFLGET